MGDRTNRVVDEIRAERVRQIEREGWTLDYDVDANDPGDLSSAASCYALNAACVLHPYNGTPIELAGDRESGWMVGDISWPFDQAWWKPTTPRRDLIKAAALIVAEIERLDRDEEAFAAELNRPDRAEMGNG